VNNKEFGESFELRTELFSVAIIKLSVKLPNTPEARVFRNQITKSATSIGANYREANRARSNLDFKNKIRINESESSETVYWLSLIKRLNWLNNEDFNNVFKESKEILALLTSISKNLRDKDNGN
jgi:four helix bundle protein